MIQKNRAYKIVGGFTEEDMEKMHNAMLDLIDNVGLNVPHDGILGILKQKEGVKIDGNTVKFKAHLVEKAIESMNYPDYAVNADYIINGGAYELNVLDLYNGKIRPAVIKDLIDMVKLADSYGVYGSSPVRPTDISSTALQEITMYKICWENSERISNNIFEANEKSSLRSAQYIYEMAQVAKKRFALGFWIKSPFKVSFEELDIIYKFLDKEVQFWCATMPISGATAPIYLTGAYVQSMAEVFAGLTLLSLINTSKIPPVCLIIDTIRAYAFDFKHASFVYGSPEDIMGTLFQVQLNKKYGIPIVAKSLLTSSNDLDIQLGSEIAAHTLTAAFAGARIFTGAGLLAIDEIYSAEKLIIDYEVVQYVKNVVNGFRFSDEYLSTDIIKEIGIGGEFVSHNSTLTEYKDAAWQPEVFEHIMLRKYIDMGKPKLKDRLNALAREKIKKHEYNLPDDIAKELNNIYDKAKTEFVT